MTAAPPQKNRTWKGPRSLPTTLPDDRRYVLWRYSSTPNGKGKYPKIPYNPHKQFPPEKPKGTYKGAKTDDTETWGTFAECMAAATDWPGWFDGIGIVILPGEVFIDLDDGVDPAHAEILHTAAHGRAYRETSVSGSGSHIIILGHVADAIKTDTIEIYEGGESRGRYCALGAELEGSTAPAAAQDVVDQAVTLSGAQPRASAPRASLRLVETVALTAELAGAIHEAESRKDDLLLELRSNMTAQLADLIYRDIFPPSLKDTSASGGRAVVVAQLHRAPKRRYTDAEIYVLARELWRRKGYEGAMKGSEKALDRDCWRLIASYRPGAPPKKTTRRYQEAPAPLVYLARLTDEASGGVVLLNRDERAALAGCSRPTAQRIEEQLVTQNLIELGTYALTGEGCKGRRGMVRITSQGLRALNESVISTTPQPDEQVTRSAPERRKPPIRPAKNTVVCDVDVVAPPTPPHHNTRVLSGAGLLTGGEHALTPPVNEWAAADAWLGSPQGQRIAAKAQRASVDQQVYARVDPIASGRSLPAPPKAECGYSSGECDRWLAAHAVGMRAFGAPITMPEVCPPFPREEVPSAADVIARLKQGRERLHDDR